MCPDSAITSDKAASQIYGDHNGSEPCCYELLCDGALQGAGVRPKVMLLAQQAGVSGIVFNRGAGITIEAQATPERWTLFLQTLAAALGGSPQDIRCNTRSLACLSSAAQQAIHAERFVIAASERGDCAWHLPLDRGICDACIAELHDETHPDRFLHLLNGCAQCGPRYSALQRLPFDREHTSLSDFALCDTCRAAYQDPSDRRCHEQLISCRCCGPAYRLLDSADATTIDDPHALLARLVTILNQGGIVAIKGVGGFHVCCDAIQTDAVQRLRQLKQRPRKPFAVMGSIDQLQRWVTLSASARQQLESTARPIVIAPLNTGASDMVTREILDGIAPGLNRLGVMLPYTGLQILLLERLGRPLVMTSCNHAGEPLMYRDQPVYSWLSELGAMVTHDREILQPVEDTVIQMIKVGGEERPQLLRLGRGMAPRVINITNSTENIGGCAVLAMGGELKNSLALAGGGGQPVVMSPYLGDLYQAEQNQRYRDFVPRFLQLLDCAPPAEINRKPWVIAVDAHPDYHASQFGRELGRHWQVPIVTVQHHHAHAAAVMAEHQLPGDRQVLALVLDGFGWGADGSLWGGELLRCDYAGYQRLAHIKTFPVVGGHLTATQPWRNALALISPLAENVWAQVQQQFMKSFPDKQQLVQGVAQILSSQANSLLQTSSAGRLFDGVAALLGFPCFAISDEAEAAVWLQQQAEQAYCQGLLDPLQQEIAGLLSPAHSDPLDPATFLAAMLSGAPGVEDVPRWALAFHVWLSSALTASVERFLACDEGAAPPMDRQRIVLAGGVMQNGLLVDLLTQALSKLGLQVLLPWQVPANDNGLALGQAVVAIAMNRNQQT